MTEFNIPALQIEHIFSLNSAEHFTETHELYELYYLENVFPIYMNSLDYRIHCFYTDELSHCQNLFALPYMILTSEYAITCTSDYQMGILYQDNDILQTLWNLFHSHQDLCQPIFQTFPIIENDLPSLFQYVANTRNSADVIINIQLGLIFLYLMMNNPGDYIDSTTGAFDKRYFDNWIQEKFTKGIEFHVIAVELFMLKQINKVYGSSTGDLLLVQIARELQNITGSVQVFRTTGNCFLIITDSLTEYEKKRQEIENYFKEPFETDGEKITFPAIICGIINGEKMEKEDVLLAYIEYLISLVKRADETVVIQSDDRILEGFRYEKEVEHFLKTAVDKDLFEVYYQPVFWTKEDRYITLEALSRLKHP